MVTKMTNNENPTVQILKDALSLCEKVCEFQRSFAK